MSVKERHVYRSMCGGTAVVCLEELMMIFSFFMIIVRDEEVNEQSFPSDALGGVKVSKPGDKSIQPGASEEGHFG